MKSTASIQNSVSNQEYTEQFRAKVDQYMAKQPMIVRILHLGLQGVSYLCIVLATIFFFTALYYTFVWATTGSFTSLGEATYLPDAWVNFGLSMSFLVFPWGLDSMLTRIFPAVIFPVTWYRSNQPLPFKTGPRYIFAGFGIMCAGAPGLVHMINLASQALQKLF